MKKIHYSLLTAALALTSTQVLALPFSSTDARSIAMGGTGVASGSIANASTFNPALLAASREDEDFNFSVAVGALARDEDNMLDAIDEIQATNFAGNDKFQQFGADIDAYVANYTGTAADAPYIADVTSSGTSLKAALNGLSNKPIEAGFNFGLNLSVPGETVGMSVFANSRALMAGSVSVAPNDLVVIDNVITAVQTNNMTSDPFATSDPQSTLNLTGGVITEAGVALATKIAGIAIGVTPKILRIDTNEISQSVNTVDTGNVLDANGEMFEDVNFDVGVAMDLGAFKIGAVGKNMIEQEYTMTNANVPGSKVIVEPQIRAGVSFDAGWATLSFDQDLTENKGLVSNTVIGDSADTQYTSLGIEFDLSILQIRAGYRTNNLDSSGDSDTVSAGIGIHALVSFDLAVAGNDQGAEAIMQLGVRW